MQTFILFQGPWKMYTTRPDKYIAQLEHSFQYVLYNAVQGIKFMDWIPLNKKQREMLLDRLLKYPVFLIRPLSGREVAESNLLANAETKIQ